MQHHKDQQAEVRVTHPFVVGLVDLDEEKGLLVRRERRRGHIQKEPEHLSAILQIFADELSDQQRMHQYPVVGQKFGKY